MSPLTFIQLLVIFAIVLVIVWIIVPATGRERRRQQKRCMKCGYDLRASSERCPECGTPVPPEPAEQDESIGLADDILATQPIEPRMPGEGERTIAVVRTSHPLEAGFFARVLEHRGIKTVVEGQSRPTDYQPPQMRVMVWSGDEEVAMAWVCASGVPSMKPTPARATNRSCSTPSPTRSWSGRIK